MNTNRSYEFPEGFAWGVATSAYQIEGAAAVDSRGPSVWDVFCRQPGRIKDGWSGDIASGHYERMEEDVDLIESLNARHYRFSLSWSRIFPDGEGSVNEKGAAFYDRLIDRLLSRGIEPAVTLFHWDLPQALEERYGGWASRETARRLGDFAEWAGRRYGDRVKRFFTINEFQCFTDFGYGSGIFAPGRKESRQVRNQVRHHGLLGHGYALQGLRAAAPDAKAGFVEDIRSVVPIMESDADIAAARLAFRRSNEQFAAAIFEGGYSEEYLAREGGDAPVVETGDFELISAPVDLLGINLYTGQYAMAAANDDGYQILDFSEQYPKTKADWMNIVPQVTYWTPRFCRELWGMRDLYIAENGCPFDDATKSGDQIMDVDRVFYYREYLKNLHRAVDEGYPVRGYFAWSLMDNFEWTQGKEMRFGLVHVDFDTLKRTPKLSARFYAEVIRQNRVV